MIQNFRVGSGVCVCVCSPRDERFVDGLSKLEGVVTDSQVVLQSEGL